VDKTTKKLIDMVAGDPALSQEFRTALARPELPVDPVSGPRPLFVPSTPLPPGAVLFFQPARFATPIHTTATSARFALGSPVTEARDA
jgi:hypothetical protein